MIGLNAKTRKENTKMITTNNTPDLDTDGVNVNDIIAAVGTMNIPKENIDREIILALIVYISL